MLSSITIIIVYYFEYDMPTEKSLLDHMQENPLGKVYAVFRSQVGSNFYPDKTSRILLFCF